MKARESDEQDRFGEYPCCWISGKDANPQNIYEWLHRNYQGYKFAILFDCTKDEFEEPEKETPVYFLDTFFDEVLAYIGIDKVKEWINKRELNWCLARKEFI